MNDNIKKDLLTKLLWKHLYLVCGYCLVVHNVVYMW